MWSRGIQANFELVAFNQAWGYIHTEATNHRLEYITRYIENGQLDPVELGVIKRDYYIDDSRSSEGCNSTSDKMVEVPREYKAN